MSGDSSVPKIAVVYTCIFVTAKLILSRYSHKSTYPFYKSILNRNCVITNNARRRRLFDSRHNKSVYKEFCSYYDMFSTEMKHCNYTFILNIEIFVTHKAQFCMQEFYIICN